MEVRLQRTAFFGTWLKNILSIMVCEWPVTLVGCKIYDKHIQEESESINSFFRAFLSYFNKSTLKSPRRKTFFFLLKFFVIVCLNSYRLIHCDSLLDVYIYNQ